MVEDYRRGINKLKKKKRLKWYWIVLIVIGSIIVAKFIFGKVTFALTDFIDSYFWG